jgi:hypothetical protein
MKNVTYSCAYVRDEFILEFIQDNYLSCYRYLFSPFNKWIKIYLLLKRLNPQQTNSMLLNHLNFVAGTLITTMKIIMLIIG